MGTIDGTVTMATYTNEVASATEDGNLVADDNVDGATRVGHSYLDFHYCLHLII